ncbi:MAG: hypothetical protein ACE5JK_02185 [Candidatus Omnitrophota bacterium]
MINKKTVFLITISIVAITALITLYFKYWHEPEATYIETKNPKLIEIRKDMEEFKSDLREEGMYHCCIKNDCNWCALYMGHCPCEKLVKMKGAEKSCPECAAAWNRKWGKIPGVDPDAIEVTTFGIYGFEKKEHHHEGMHHHEGEHSH